MGMLARARRQKATYWEPDTQDRFGDKTFKTPVVLDVRWEGSNEQFLASDGSPQVSMAEVFIDGTDTRVVMGGYLMLGVLGVSEPLTLHDEATEIRHLQDTPNYKATETEKIARL